MPASTSACLPLPVDACVYQCMPVTLSVENSSYDRGRGDVPSLSAVKAQSIQQLRLGLGLGLGLGLDMYDF